MVARNAAPTATTVSAPIPGPAVTPAMPVAAPASAAMSPGLAAKSAVPATVQRPNLAQPVKPPSIDAPANASVLSIATATTSAPMKSEPPATTTTPTTSSPAPTSSSPAATTPTSKNEQLEKIQFAKKLLFHASTCTLSPGVCQVKKCDDVRRVFKHSASCGGARSCSHCEQLKGLVKYHAKECLTAANDHCTIPFCDALRRAYISAAATLAAKSKTSLSTAGVNGGAGAASRLGAASDDDDDNTPLSSAVNKAKKNSKAKSPKASPTVRTTATASPAASSASSAASKKKGAAASTAAKPATPATTTTTTAASSAAATAAAGKQAAAKPAVTANMTVEYGRLLQLILHVQKCTATVCPVGEECAEAKSLLRQINSPNAPVRG